MVAYVSHEVPVGLLTPALSELVASNHLAIESRENSEDVYTLTSRGLRALEALAPRKRTGSITSTGTVFMRIDPELPEDSNVPNLTPIPSAGTAPTFISSDLDPGSSVKAALIPAADRIVCLDDNAPGRREAIENLERVEAALDSGSNELNLTADERIVVLSETRSLRERLADGRVRLGALAQAIAPDGFLILITRTLAQESIVNAANIAISAIKTLLQIFI